VLASWSKLPDKVKHGNTFDFGDFDRCLAVHYESERVGVIKGQHCMFQFQSESNDTIVVQPEESRFNSGWRNLNERFGATVCLPASCSPEVVNEFLRFWLMGTGYKVADDYDQAGYCKTVESVSAPPKYALPALAATLVLIVLALGGTFYDFLTRKTEKKQRNERILAFSIIQNGSSLFNLTNEPKDDVKCFHFLRSFFAIVIVFYHIFIFVAVLPNRNFHDLYRKPTAQIVSFFSSSVNGFFVISAFLATKSIMKDIKS
jgi:hypothetical protein